MSLPRRDALPADAFRRDFLATDTPVVLSGAASAWPCCQRWTPAFVAERYGDETVRLLLVARGQRPVPGASRDARFDEIAASTEAGGPLYARFSGLLHRHPELVAGRKRWTILPAATTSTNPPPWRAKGHRDLPTLLDAIEY